MAGSVVFALWTFLVQTSLCDHMSTRAWKPDENLISTRISGGVRPVCCDVPLRLLCVCKTSKPRFVSINGVPQSSVVNDG